MGMEGTLGPQARAKGPIVNALYGQPACLKSRQNWQRSWVQDRLYPGASKRPGPCFSKHPGSMYCMYIHILQNKYTP